MFNWLQIGAGVALGALVASGPLYLYGKHEGRQQAAVDVLKASLKAREDRTHENETVDALDPVALCVELGGLPDECAAELRRLGEDPAPAGDRGLSRRP